MGHATDHQFAMVLTTVFSVDLLLFAFQVQIVIDYARRAVLFEYPRLGVRLLNFIFLKLVVANRPFGVAFNLILFSKAIVVVDPHQGFIHSSAEIDETSVNKYIF